MIVILLFLFGLFISFILAYLSMGDYQETPPERLNYSLFLIRNLSALNKEFLASLHNACLKSQTFFSFEKLIKGGREATTWYVPKDLALNYPKLHPVELEDYTERVSEKEIFCWELIKGGSRRILRSKKTSERSYLKPLKALNLGDGEQVFFQLIVAPKASAQKTEVFQVTARIVIAAPDSKKRTELARRVDSRLKTETDFIRKKSPNSSSQIFLSYKKRGFIPAEIAGFNLGSDQILGLIK